VLGHVDRDYATKGEGIGTRQEGGEEMGRAHDLQGEQLGEEGSDKPARGEKCEDCS
jgi:hypothetical protein